MFAPKRILVPTDYSQYSDAALKYAIDMAKQSGAKIYLLHVIGLVQSCAVDYCFDQATLNVLEEKSSSSAEDMMKHQLEQIPEAKSADITTDIRSGIPHEEILNEQKARDVDLIVMSSHGKTGILGHLLGSVAEKVMKKATCPVLLIRQPLPGEPGK